MRSGADGRHFLSVCQHLALACVSASAFAIGGAAQAAVTISSGATQNMDCSNGICSPTATDANLSVTDLENDLASGNLTVTTTGSGVQANNIDVAARLSWSASSTLGLDAYQSIRIDRTMTAKGVGGLVFTTNDGGTGGMLSFGRNGAASFTYRFSDVSINGTAFTLEPTLAALARDIAANPAGAFALARNFDASKDGVYGLAPVETTFTGTFEGLGHTISNLTIVERRGASDIGLFADVGIGGTVESVALSNVTVKTLQDRDRAIGSLVGENEGTLFNDRASGSVYSKKDPEAGGLVGASSFTSSILQSSADVSVRCDKIYCDAGGLVGESAAIISQSRASGHVTATGFVGGLVADNSGPISQSFATGAVLGSDAGALVGANDTSGSSIGTIANSYATGEVSSGSEGGGLLAEDSDGNGVSIQNAYATGLVNPLRGQGAGFVCGALGSQVANGYWDTTTSGTTDGLCGGNVPEVVGLTTQQLQSGLPSGFDSSIWAENPGINNGFPYLIANPPPK